MNGHQHDLTLRYIADPMCSQCYGIAPLMDQVAAYCDQHGLGFSLTMGGLRAGGGVPWNEGFRAFLREEWTDIQQVTGQPFDFSFFDLADFNYDTEPSCRAVVVAQHFLAKKDKRPSASLAFFKAAQEQFYACARDPKEVDTYRATCDAVGIDFEEFRSMFSTPWAAQATHQQLVQGRLWGVRDFPTLLLEAGGEIIQIACGFKQAKTVLDRLLALTTTSAQ